MNARRRTRCEGKNNSHKEPAVGRIESRAGANGPASPLGRRRTKRTKDRLCGLVRLRLACHWLRHSSGARAILQPQPQSRIIIESSVGDSERSDRLLVGLHRRPPTVDRLLAAGCWPEEQFARSSFAQFSALNWAARPAALDEAPSSPPATGDGRRASCGRAQSSGQWSRKSISCRRARISPKVSAPGAQLMWLPASAAQRQLSIMYSAPPLQPRRRPRAVGSRKPTGDRRRMK